MSLVEQARASVGPQYTEFTRVDVITPIMPYDAGCVMARDPATGEIAEILFSSEADTAPRVRVLGAEEAAHVTRSGILKG